MPAGIVLKVHLDVQVVFWIYFNAQFNLYMRNKNHITILARNKLKLFNFRQHLLPNTATDWVISNTTEKNYKMLFNVIC